MSNVNNDPRIEEILKALDIIKTKLPNGELEVIKRSIQSLSEDQKSIKEDLEYFKKRLFNPDDGVIVRINKNTDAIMRNEEMVEEIPLLKNRIDNMEKWQTGVNKALWFVFTTIGGIIIALVFAAVTKK
jgi:hypothetical protein